MGQYRVAIVSYRINFSKITMMVYFRNQSVECLTRVIHNLHLIHKTNNSSKSRSIFHINNHEYCALQFSIIYHPLINDFFRIIANEQYLLFVIIIARPLVNC